MDYPSQVQKLFQIENRRWLLVLGLVAITHLLCQSLMLPYDALLSRLPDSKIALRAEEFFLSRQYTIVSVPVNNSDLLNTSDSTSGTLFVGFTRDDKSGKVGQDNAAIGVDRYMLTDLTVDEKGLEHHSKDEDVGIDEDFVSEDTVHIDETVAVENIEQREYFSTLDKADEATQALFIKQTINPGDGVSVGNILGEDTSISEEAGNGIASLLSSSVSSSQADPLISTTYMENHASDTSSSLVGNNKSKIVGHMIVDQKNENHVLLPSRHANANNNSAMQSGPEKKKMKCEMPPKSVTTISEMNSLLVRRRASSRAMRPRWSSTRDQEILAAKIQIQNAPSAKDEKELYAPLFRNVSMFKRSYELMERMLKVYVYKEGEKPIFHQPILKGLYASEGWFMKLMEGNKHFVVKDPEKAHLFYMPFSSRMLEYTIYVRNSHNRTNLRQYLKNYSEKISAKYPFFNRTGGADHFLVACHDWAPYETRHHMEYCIKALCNADVTAGFKIGRDVSLPETYVRAARNPLKDLGGKPPSLRPILAFYAGNMHGYLRPVLLKYWKNKDPTMKIFELMPPGVASKMSYIQHMKSSKYCICPKGYEVNSPRVVEAIYYECVPVIISDNFVPPFFDVLDWSAFSLILAEKDIPNLKDILLSVSEEKYLDMQLGVRKVQRHFLWHAKPIKYDLFHMTLHSIWYNRVFQIKPR